MHGVNKDFHVVEHFVQLIPMISTTTTTGADILQALLQCLVAMNLNLSELVSITTHGAPSIVGKNIGVMSLLQKHVKDLRINDDIIKLQCLIHQEALCAKI